MSDNTHSLKVLFADDEDSLRTIIANILTMEGHFTVDACENGEEAVEHLKQDRYDVIVLDYKMPGLSGLNVLQWIHEQKIDTPVIMLTAAGTETVAVEAMKLGAYDYIRKEHVEIDHLPIIINGVYERYCFKKEKDLRAKTAQRNFDVVLAYNQAIVPISTILKEAIEKLSADVQKYEQELRPVLPDRTSERLLEAFSSIKQDQSVISFAISSVLNLTNSLCENIVDGKTTGTAGAEQVAAEKTQTATVGEKK